MQLVLSWPVRVIVLALLVFSIFVDGAAYWYRIAHHCPLSGTCKGTKFPPDFAGWQLFVHKGLDISGGTRMVLQLTDIPTDRNAATVQQEAIGVIQKRITTSLGVAEPDVRPQGSDRIEVDLAGVSANRAQEVIGRTQRLVLTKWVPDTKAPGSSPEAGQKPQLTGLTGDMVTSAQAAIDQNSGQWVVNMNFNSQGASLFGKLTTEAYNACPDQSCPQNHLTWWLDLTQTDINEWDHPEVVQQVALPISLGGKFVTDPTTQSPIPGGAATISGQFTEKTAKDLADSLNLGALPANIQVLSSTDVGATLGADSVKRSLLAGLLGLLVVIVFMFVYYRLPGLLASLALVFYAGAVLAIFKAWPITLTLAGMAGFVLSVGMAVDANVLIFERFKEEMRAGRTVGAAVEAAVRRAWPAIRDSNFSTFFTSLLLVAFGQGTVLGDFGLTLAIGVAFSMLSSIIVTHNLLAIMLNFGSLRQPRFLGVARGRA